MLDNSKLAFLDIMLMILLFSLVAGWVDKQRKR